MAFAASDRKMTRLRWFYDTMMSARFAYLAFWAAAPIAGIHRLSRQVVAVASSQDLKTLLDHPAFAAMPAVLREAATKALQEPVETDDPPAVLADALDILRGLSADGEAV
ncbi:MAG TPA: hypothetical protein VFF96_05565, partial [Pseudoxanthomonas sp.]|nr:hypothetical protein [Pseudoxanthomonas sp.]